MTIYIETNITEYTRQIFKPTRLCIKKCRGVYYFCKSTRKDIYRYTGSGVAWKDLIKKHGKQSIETLWVSDWYYNPDEIQKIAIHFSRENDIVNSRSWANLVPEWGIDFTTRKGMRDSEETRKRKRESRLGERNPMHGLVGNKSPHYGKKHSEETCVKQSVSLKRYSLSRPETHNKNISKSLQGNINLIQRVTGDKNPGFKGYYISPTGQRFDSSRKAAVVAGVKDKKTLISWAKSNKNGWSYEPKISADV